MKKNVIAFSRTEDVERTIHKTFDVLFRNHTDSVFRYGTVQNYPAQAVIFHQDTMSHAVYMVEQGLIKLVRIQEKGQPIIVGLRRRHWLIGGPCVILDRQYSCTAITLVPSTLRCITARDFLDLVKTDEDFSWYVHLILSQENLKQMENAEARNCLPAKQRMKHLLRDMISDQLLNGSRSSPFSLPLTNKEISQLLAITPEHLCRVLKEMKQEGLVRYDNRVLTVNNPASIL